MFRNPFISAKTSSDWLIGLVIAAYSAVLCSLFLILITRFVG